MNNSAWMVFGVSEGVWVLFSLDLWTEVKAITGVARLRG